MKQMMTANVSATRRVCGANHRKLDRQALRSQFRRRFGYCQANQQLFRASSEETLSPRAFFLSPEERNHAHPSSGLRERLGMVGNGQKKLLAFGKTHQSVWIFFAKGIDTGGDGGITSTTGPLKGFAEQKQKIGLQKPLCRGRPSLERHKGSVPAEPETKQKQEVASDDFQTSV
jgi:hypothetical protein